MFWGDLSTAKPAQNRKLLGKTKNSSILFNNQSHSK